MNVNILFDFVYPEISVQIITSFRGKCSSLIITKLRTILLNGLIGLYYYTKISTALSTWSMHLKNKVKEVLTKSRQYLLGKQMYYFGQYYMSCLLVGLRLYIYNLIYIIL